MKYLLLFTCLIFFTCCSSRKEEGLKIIELDVTKISNKSFDEFYKLKKVIPMETVEGSFMGQVDKIILANEKLFVKGQRDNIIVVFDLEGKYLYTFNKQGKGPGEYLNIQDFYVDENGIIICSRNGDTRYYDKEGNFLREAKRNVGIGHFEILPNGDWLANYSLMQMDKIDGKSYILRILDKEGNYIKGFPEIPDLNIVFPLTNPSPLFSSKGQYWGIPITENIIYEYDLKDTLFIPRYQYNIKNFPIPNLEKLTWDELIKPFILEYYMFFSPYVGEKTILLNAYCGNAEKNKMVTIITDRSTGNTEVFKSLLDKENGLNVNRFFQHIGFGKEIVTYISPLSLLEEEIEDKNLMAYHLQQKVEENDNPILFIYEEK